MAYKTLKQHDDGFRFVDGIFSVPRAMLLVTPECPSHYRDMIQDARDRGWLVVKANIPESELMWGKLQS